MLGRNDLITALTKLSICRKGKQSLQACCNYIRKGKKPLQTGVTALVKGSVTRGRAPPPEAHVIKYARGSAEHSIKLYGRISFVLSSS